MTAAWKGRDKSPVGSAEARCGGVTAGWYLHRGNRSLELIYNFTTFDIRRDRGENGSNCFGYKVKMICFWWVCKKLTVSKRKARRGQRYGKNVVEWGEGSRWKRYKMLGRRPASFILTSNSINSSVWCHTKVNVLRAFWLLCTEQDDLEPKILQQDRKARSTATGSENQKHLQTGAWQDWYLGNWGTGSANAPNQVVTEADLSLLNNENMLCTLVFSLFCLFLSPKREIKINVLLRTVHGVVVVTYIITIV